MGTVLKSLLLNITLRTNSSHCRYLSVLLENHRKKLPSSTRLYSQVSEENSVHYDSNHNSETVSNHSSCNLSDELRTDSQKLAISPAVDFQYLDTVAPPLQRSFNLAPYADKSDVLQQLVKLGVDLSVIEANGTELSSKILNLNFYKDVKPVIQFLYDTGVPSKEFARVITKNPYIFQLDVRYLHIRVRYLTSKGFDARSVARIIAREPRFLNMNTKTTDSRLGYIQSEFGFTDKEVIYLITRNPNLLNNKVYTFKATTFCIHEEMGFDKTETKTLLFTKPKIWLTPNKYLSERFLYLHQKMGLSHESIVNFPGCLTCRKFRFQQRHEYLVKLGRAQYDATLPNYVSLKGLVSSTDSDFCWNFAKTSVADFNLFLKSF